MGDPSGISVGLLYEDCSYHPCLCIGVEGDEVRGISLIDGSAPRTWSLSDCAPEPMSVTQAVAAKAGHEHYVSLRGRFGIQAAVERL